MSYTNQHESYFKAQAHIVGPIAYKPKRLSAFTACLHGWYTYHCSLLCQYSLKVPIQATVQHLYDKNKISILFTELLGQSNI